MFGAHGLVHAEPGGLNPALELDPKLRDPGAQLARSLHQLNHESVRELLGKRRQRRVRGRRLEAREVEVRFPLAHPALHDLVREASQVLDQAELEHARPCPQLSEGERGHHLVGAHEPRKTMEIEARVAVADELEGHGVHPGHARQIAHRELGKVQVVPLREVLPYLEDLRLDEVEVVEEPFRRGRHGLAAAHVGGQNLVRPAQDAGILVEPGQKAARPLAWIARQRVAGGQNARAFLQVLDAQELAAEGSRVRARPEAAWILPVPEHPARAHGNDCTGWRRALAGNCLPGPRS